MKAENGMTATPVEPIVSQPLPLDSIVCGDNVATMQGFPDASIDLVVTSPPYDSLRVYGGHSWDFEGVAQQLWRVIKPGGVVVWVVADATVNGSETGTSFRQALRFMEIGFRLHDTMIFQKTTFSMPFPNRYHDVFEYCFVLANGKVETFNALMDRRNTSAGRTTSVTVREPNDEITRRSDKTIQLDGKRWNVWVCDSARNDNDNGDHPAPFPEALARDHILSWSNEGDIVLDPFNGSGTTTKMARLMGRRFIGIDVNESYCEIARKRLAQKLLDFGDAG
jgi:site-specific DNA-methyltransferase (adenine-specific)